MTDATTRLTRAARDSYNRAPGSNPDANAAFRRLSDTVRTTWGKALQGVENAYKVALAAFNGLRAALMQALLDEARVVATKLVTDNSAGLLDMKTQIEALTKDPEMHNTIQRAAAAGKKSPDNLADVRAGQLRSV